MMKQNKRTSISTLKKLKSLVKNFPAVYKFDIFIIILGITCYFFGYYFIILYGLMHLTVRVLQSVSKTFANKLLSFRNDQDIIKKHYLKDFKFCYYFVMVVKIVTGCFYYYFFCLLSPEHFEHCSFLFFTITYTFILTNLFDLGIIIYIILYKNTPVKDAFVNLCYHCATKSLYSLGFLHMSSNVLMISPNPVTNSYHLLSPLGRGYGAYSSTQLFQVDIMKTELGSEFDYTQCIDDSGFLNSQKMVVYSEKNNININKISLDHSHYWGGVKNQNAISQHEQIDKNSKK